MNHLFYRQNTSPTFWQNWRLCLASGLLLLLTLIGRQAQAQTNPASVTVSGACLNSTYILPKFSDNYESTGKPAYQGTGSVTINTTAYEGVGLAVYYEASSPAGWVLALDGQPYLTIATNSALPPLSGWQVVSGGTIGNCTGGVGLSVITVPPSVSISPANPTAVCAGASVNLTATAAGIPATVSYAWSSSPAGFSGSSNILTQNAPNVGTSTTYTISVTASNGSSRATSSVTLLVNPIPTITQNGSTNPTTCGGTNGSIGFTTSLPNGTYQLSYTGAGSPKTITVLSGAFSLTALGAGTYSNFSVTNNGCTGSANTTVTLNNPTAPTLALGSPTNPTACGGTNGSIGFTTSLPNGTYQLSYTGAGSPKAITVSSGAFSLTGLGAGSYSNFSVTNNGCTGSVATAVNLSNPTPTLTVSGSGSPTTCGGTNGFLSFTTTNLVDGTYTLNYTGPGSSLPVTVVSNAFSVSGLGQGNYSNFSINGNGCSATSAPSVSLTDPPTPTLVFSTSANPSTCGGTDGSISFTTTNLPNGTYQLSYTGAGSPKTITVTAGAFSLTGLAAGNYSAFSVTNNGCVGSSSPTVTLAEPATPTLVFSTSANPSTCSGTNGSISFTTNLPNGTYQLSYTGAGSPKTITVTTGAFSLTGLAAGAYSNFSVTNNACTGSLNTTISLSDPVAPTLTQNGSTNPTTCGGSNGSIGFTTNLPNGTYQLSYTGAGSPKTIAVTAGAFSLTGLTAGSYSNFSVTNNGCVGSSSPTVTLVEPATPTLVFSTSANPSTCSGTNGSISFTTNLPNGTYQLSYTGAGSPKTIAVTSGAFSLTGLAAGAYSNFSVTNNACTGSLNTTINLSDPATPTLTQNGSTNPSTCGGTNGSISFNTNLSNGTYQLSYTGAGSPKTIAVAAGAFSLTGLAAGTYSAFSVTNNGCVGSSSASITLNNPPTPTLVFSTSANPSTCSGTNGSISFTTNLPNGTYQLSYTGAGSPKTIAVISGAFSLTGLASGSYSNFSVTNNACTGSLNTTISLSDPITPTLTQNGSTNPTTCGGSNGSIGFTTNLPNGTYQLSYTGAGSPKPITVTAGAFSLTGLAAGSYSAFSISNNGCVGSSSASITLNNPPTPTLVFSTSANPSTCSGTNGSISFTTNLPNGTYQLSYTGAGSPKTIAVASGVFSLTGLAAGSYSNFSVTNNGCVGSSSASITLNNPPTPTLAQNGSTNPTTCGGSNGSIGFTTTNLPNGTYQLSYTGAGSPKTITVTAGAFSLTGLTAGAYSNFSVTNNGCTGSLNSTVSLSDPASPALMPGTPTNPTTCGGNNGSISFTTTNLPNGTYQLSYTGAGSPKTVTVNTNAFSLTGLGAGSYSNFSITNNGCVGSASTSITLNNPPTPTLAQNGSTNPTTCGGSNGSIGFTTTNLPNGTYQLSYTGAGSPKTITVTAGAFSLTGLTAGAYSNFSVTNNGCTGSLNSTVSLSDPSAPSVTLTSNGTLTCSNVQVTLTATTGAASYLFSSGASQVGGSAGNTATVTNPGLYSVTFVASNGCRSTASVNVFSNTTLNAPSLQASATSTTNQPISVTATGCAGTINWNSQGGVGSANGSVYTYTQPGNYVLTASCTVGTCTSPSSSPVNLQILPGIFAINRVTTVSCQVINAVNGRYRISFTPVYSGQNSNPISFSVVNELLPTTNTGPYTLELYSDNATITLVAAQAGNGVANFSYNWLAACQGSTPTNNPPATSGIPSQTIIQGQAYQLNLNNYFSDPDGQTLTYTAQNLPAGLSINGSSISGTPSATGVSSVIITAIDPVGASVNTSFQLRVNPAPTSPGGFAIVGVSMVNCEVLRVDQRRITFTPQYGGTTGGPISFSVVNEMLPTTNPGPYTLTLYTDNPTIGLRAQQGSSTASYQYNWLASCTTPGRVGADESGSVLQVKVLGNPVEGKSAEIEIQGVQGQSVLINLVDLQGKPLHQQRIEQAASTERVTVPMGAHHGAFLLNVSTNQQQKQVKLIRP